jgi:uncharacterized membrane protein YgdD (TMEM256/DUF423 family)
MNAAIALRIAAVFGFCAVALGAFGAHLLKEHLAAKGTTAIWEKAVLYHLAHAIALLVVAMRNPAPAVAAWLFVAGITIFSGSLY